MFTRISAFCSGALDLGPSLTSIEVFAEAEKRFDRAIAMGTTLGLSTIVNAATLGRARMRLYQGNNMAGALSDAKAIPEGFVFTVQTASTTPETANRVWWSTWGGLYLGVPEWVRTLTVEGVPATRVNGVNEGTFGGDGRPYWGSATKHRNQDSPLLVARWAEAQLIIAEIEGGQQAVSIINALRDGHGLPPFASTNEQEIQDQVLEERRRELFIEGFRAYDLRRANLPLVSSG